MGGGSKRVDGCCVTKHEYFVPMRKPAVRRVTRMRAPPFCVSSAATIPWSSSSQPSPRLRGPEYKKKEQKRWLVAAGGVAWEL